ncbi:hypothetical protein ACOSP7_015405 [Xanthoceras sorbifolium]
MTSLERHNQYTKTNYSFSHIQSCINVQFEPSIYRGFPTSILIHGMVITNPPSISFFELLQKTVNFLPKIVLFEFFFPRNQKISILQINQHIYISELEENSLPHQQTVTMPLYPENPLPLNSSVYSTEGNPSKDFSSVCNFKPYARQIQDHSSTENK